MSWAYFQWKSSFERHQKTPAPTPHAPVIPLQRLLRYAQQPTGGVYYQWSFFPHFWRCKDKKKNNISQQNQKEFKTEVASLRSAAHAVAKPGLPSSVPPWRQSKLAKRPFLVHSKGIKKHQFSTPRTRHPFTEVASLRSVVHGGRILSIQLFSPLLRCKEKYYLVKTLLLKIFLVTLWLLKSKQQYGRESLCVRQISRR